jgi:hypothetical protein
MALGSTQPLTEMSTRNLPGGKGRPACKAHNFTAICEFDYLELWEPRHLTTQWASTTCCGDSIHLRLGLPSCLFRSAAPANTPYALHVSPVHATYVKTCRLNNTFSVTPGSVRQKIRPWVPWNPQPRMTVLARTRSNLPE